MFQLRGYQEYAVTAAVNHVKYSDGHGFVQAAGGAGKSLMIAKTAERLLDIGKRKILILTRSEKLLRQNQAKLDHPEKSSIYCASIGERDTSAPIVLATIQSIANYPDAINPDVVLVDECDEISDNEETQYQQFLARNGNPQIIGWTATPFRTKTGHISWGEEITSITFAALVKDGWLCPPVNKASKNTPDVSSVQIKLGEYVEGQLEEIYLSPELLTTSIQTILAYGADRNHGIIFCQSRKHARIITDALNENSPSCAIYVDGDTPKQQLDALIESRPKYLVNNNLLTVGYDIPWADMIVILRSTLSKRLFEQMAYRGSRLHPESGKRDFLLLDMGGNLIRHGALGSPFEGSSSTKESPKPKGRICPECETYTPSIRDKQCPDCGYEFPPPEEHEITHNMKPDTDSNPLGETITREPQYYNVREVRYHTRKSKKGDHMVVVTYIVDDYTSHTEYLLPFHAHELPRSKAWGYLSQAQGMPISPLKCSIDEFLIYCETSPSPKRILVKPQKNNPKYSDIVRFYENDGSSDTESVDTLDSDCIPF